MRNPSVRMEDLLSCMVCCEPYQEKMRHPVLLPRCGHSFCRPCIAFMVKGGNVVCPSCRMDQRVETADDLPTEFSLLAITAAQQVAKLETCQLHDVKLSFWCKSCKMATCGECLFEDHPTNSHDVIKATRYIIEMKDAINDLANKFMETLDIRERRLYDLVYKSAKGINDALRTICVLRKDMEEARDLMKGVKKVDGIAPTTRLSEAAKFLGLKWNLHDAKLGLGPASLKKAQSEKEAEAQKEAEKKQDSPEEKEEDKGKEETEKEDKEKEDDDKTKQAKDGENNDKEDDDDEDEESTDESEEEVLTEEEIKKRQKILKVKERIAAAAAAAAAEKELKEKKMMEKERKAVKEKNNANPEPEQVPSPKLLKSWKKRSAVATVSREPSITPERELQKKEKSEKIESPTEKEDANKQSDKDKENAENEDKIKTEETEAKAESREPSNEKDNKETKETANNPPAKKDASQETSPNDPPKAANEPSNANPPKEKEKAKEEAEAKEAKKEAETKKEKEAKKAPAAAKRPRGRLARQALKRAQTMDLSKRAQAEGDKEEVEAESQNIKGLDLETGKSNKPEETENKESEAGASGETKEEAKEDKKEKEEEKTEEKKKEEEARGATAVKEDEEEAMFELDPDEKDRIATELMMVPSLTVCVEGRGGLMARVQWEPQGLHVYSHQAQDLPYDVLIKSSVLNALIPTKSPTVFLDIEYEQRMLGRVYITLFGHLRRANNFLLLCTGETGASLKSSKFFEVCNPEAPGERLKGGDYEFNNGRGGEALVEELEFGGDYAQPMEAGMITAGGSGHRCFDSQFLICTEGDPNRNFACPFGVVTSGLSYLKEAVWLVVTKEIWIEECGVLLDMPRF